MTDFYRELGHLFGFPVSSSNRWGSHKAVRAKWQEHIQQKLFRPILLIDEAQEMSGPLLAELRLLGSTKLDTCTIITVVLSGDRRIEDHLREPDLAPVNSRIRARLVLDVETPETLGTMLRHILTAAVIRRLPPNRRRPHRRRPIRTPVRRIPKKGLLEIKKVLEQGPSSKLAIKTPHLFLVRLPLVHARRLNEKSCIRFERRIEYRARNRLGL